MINNRISFPRFRQDHLLLWQLGHLSSRNRPIQSYRHRSKTVHPYSVHVRRYLYGRQSLRIRLLERSSKRQERFWKIHQPSSIESKRHCVGGDGRLERGIVQVFPGCRKSCCPRKIRPKYGCIPENVQFRRSGPGLVISKSARGRSSRQRELHHLVEGIEARVRQKWLQPERDGFRSRIFRLCILHYSGNNKIRRLHQSNDVRFARNMGESRATSLWPLPLRKGYRYST